MFMGFRTHTIRHVRVDTQTHTHTNTYIHAYTQTCIHTYIHMHRYTHMNLEKRIQMDEHTIHIYTLSLKVIHSCPFITFMPH